MDAIAQLRRRKRWHAIFVGIFVFILVMALADHLGAFGYRGDDWAKFDRAEAIVLRVIDGATIEVLAGKRKAIVRLMGVTASNDSSYLDTVLSGKSVRLKLEPLEPRDNSGQLVAYVYLGEKNVNLDLLSTGHARLDRSRDHVMRAMFQLAESQARKGKLGVWAE